MGQIVISEWRHFKNQGGTLLVFPSLITELCKKAKVKEYGTDTWVHPGPYIFPLKIWGEGPLGQSNKRKIDLGKYIVEESESCKPSTVGPLEGIRVDIRVIKEMVLGFP